MGLHFKKNKMDLSDKEDPAISHRKGLLPAMAAQSIYVAGDVKLSKVSNRIVDITKIDFEDESFDY